MENNKFFIRYSRNFYKKNKIFRQNLKNIYYINVVARITGSRYLSLRRKPKRGKEQKIYDK